MYLGDIIAANVEKPGVKGQFAGIRRMFPSLSAASEVV